MYRRRSTLLLILMLALSLILTMTSCGKKEGKKDDEKADKGAAQTIEFRGITMEIPGEWGYSSEASKDSKYVTYIKRTDDKVDVWFQITWTEIAVDINENYTLEDAGKTLVDIYKELDENESVSDAEQGEFTDKGYKMNTITCKENIDGEVKYVKNATVYMDNGTFKFVYKNKDEDYSAFTKALESASYDPSANKTEKEDKGDDRDSDPEPSDVTKLKSGKAEITLPGKWKYSKEASNKSADAYMKGDDAFIISTAKVGVDLKGETLGKFMTQFLDAAGYGDQDYHDYTVGDGIEAKIMYIDGDKSKSKQDERYVLFGDGENAIVYAYTGSKSGYSEIKDAFKTVKVK